MTAESRSADLEARRLEWVEAGVASGLTEADAALLWGMAFGLGKSVGMTNAVCAIGDLGFEVGCRLLLGHAGS